MQNFNKNWFKFSAAFIACLAIRLIPIRPPNIEPIMATQMPMSKVYGPYFGFIFSFLSIVAYDLLTGTLGMWSLFTATTYGVLGLAATFYFRNKKGTGLDYVRFAIFGTLFFDAVTGLSVGPLFFHQSFYNALIGQIPFTMLHLVGNVLFAYMLSPAIYSLFIKKKKFERKSIINIFNPKTI
ncbi:MAG: hypothetical protein KBC06_00380 [Candidatus Pacebacteria bacterium]|nr:hypothetical protein [Candidatus Paceibacterota bacterium]